MASTNFGKVRGNSKENQPALRHQNSKGLSSNNGRETRAHKRTVLGSITNNVVRVQPSRAVKTSQDIARPGGIQDENSGVMPKLFGKGKDQPFTIFVEDQPPAASQPATTLPSRQAFAPVQMDHEENRIPSLTEAIVKLPSVNSAKREHLRAPSYLLDMSGVEEETEDLEDSDGIEDAQSPSVPMNQADREAVIVQVPEYAEDIYSYLLTVEHRHRPRSGFMNRQTDVTLGMRSILVDWLVEVAEEYKLQRETLFLTVNYIDRFLSSMFVARAKLQLVGAAAMFLAAKYEEIYPPDVNEFVYITDDTYTKKQILRMEHMMLRELKFNVNTPTINWFMERLLRNVDAGEMVSMLTMYICELVLVDYDKFLDFPCSMVAASALCLSNHTLDQELWSQRQQTSSRYCLKQLLPCLQVLYTMHAQSHLHPQQAIREKYRLPKFEKVAEISPKPFLFGTNLHP